MNVGLRFKLFGRRFLSLLAALWTFVYVGPAVADVHIGVVAPLSGQFSVFGEEMKAGAEQAVADLNANGGLNGEPVTLDLADDACKVEDATAVANQMIGKGVVAVIGHFCAQPSLEVASIYAAQDILQISPSVIDPQFTDERAGPGVFRFAPRRDEQGKIAADYILQNLSTQAIAILHDQGSYGKTLADAVKSELNAENVYETFYSGYEPGRRDYGALASRLQSDGVEVAFVGGYAADVALIAKALATRGMETLIMGGETLLLEEYWTLSEGAGEGSLAVHYVDPKVHAAAKQLAERLQDNGRPNGRYALQTYAAIEALAAAVTDAGTTDFAEVANTLASQGLSTIFGEVRFDDKGDMTLPGYTVYRWSEGAYLATDAM
ncbi:MAG: branched-chain amino acid ABC transporter substrate-binding protein [Rhodobacteraceae bacterium]|nr:branched-chain amino acid ABC transporter substrate-binding protein [Paracoccaceae bacterium]